MSNAVGHDGVRMEPPTILLAPSSGCRPQRARLLLLLVVLVVLISLGGHRVVVRVAEELFNLGVHGIAA